MGKANLRYKDQRPVITAPRTRRGCFAHGHLAHNALAAEAWLPLPSPVMSQWLLAGGEQENSEKRD